MRSPPVLVQPLCLRSSSPLRLSSKPLRPWQFPQLTQLTSRAPLETIVRCGQTSTLTMMLMMTSHRHRRCPSALCPAWARRRLLVARLRRSRSLHRHLLRPGVVARGLALMVALFGLLMSLVAACCPAFPCRGAWWHLGARLSVSQSLLQLRSCSSLSTVPLSSPQCGSLCSITVLGCPVLVRRLEDLSRGIRPPALVLVAAACRVAHPSSGVRASPW